MYDTRKRPEDMMSSIKVAVGYYRWENTSYSDNKETTLTFIKNQKFIRYILKI
jgi:hypothetical protein